MTRKEQQKDSEGEFFPVRFDIKTTSEDQTKKVQGLFQAQGQSMNLSEVRRMIYDRGLTTFDAELKKLEEIKAVAI